MSAERRIAKAIARILSERTFLPDCYDTALAYLQADLEHLLGEIHEDGIVWAMAHVCITTADLIAFASKHP